MMLDSVASVWESSLHPDVAVLPVDPADEFLYFLMILNALYGVVMTL